jgi:ubiquitin carboxyl-terminal hydrolase MINDY-1/2
MYADDLCIEYLCKDDVLRRLDVSQSAVGPFGFYYQQRVSTPLGLGTVLGVCNAQLYFLLDSDAKASCWSDCHTAHDFREKNILSYEEPIQRASTVCSGGASSDYHNLKKIRMGGREYPIVMQSANGPCPVIALANALILKGELHDIVPLGSSAIAAASLRGQLLAYLSIPHAPPPIDDDAPSKRGESLTLAGLIREKLEDLRSNLLDGPEAESLLHRFYSGLDVSPIFSHPDGFGGDEQNAVLFALGGVRLVHGWIFEEEHRFGPLRDMSYTEVQLRMFQEDEAQATLAAELTNYPAQLTVAGLAALSNVLHEGEVCVLFYNNHFSTVIKRDGALLRLLSDVSYLDRSCIVFEKVLDDQNNVEYLGADGEEVDAIVLGVQSKVGDRYSDDDILLARAELLSENLINACAEDVIHKLERRTSAAAASSTAAHPSSVAGPAAASALPLITFAPASPSVRPSGGQFLSAPSPLAIPQDPSAKKLMEMGLCATMTDAREALALYGTVEAAVDAILGGGA